MVSSVVSLTSNEPALAKREKDPNREINPKDTKQDREEKEREKHPKHVKEGKKDREKGRRR